MRLIQSVTAEDRPNVGLTVIVLKTADQKSRLMRVLAPLGVLLPSGLGLKIDNRRRPRRLRALPAQRLRGRSADGRKAAQAIARRPAPRPSSSSRRRKRASASRWRLKGFGEGFDKLP
jgi:invasion protein IalB